MGWGFATEAEVIGAADQAIAEVSLPDAIDDHPRGEGVIGVSEPMGEFETTAVVGW